LPNIEPEIRVTDPKTGGAKGSKEARYDLIPPEALDALARLYGRGCKKYSPRNWERGYAWGLSFAALMRHAWSHWCGEEIDEETGSPHIIQAAWHCFTLHTFAIRRLGTDDRPFSEGKEFESANS